MFILRSCKYQKLKKVNLKKFKYQRRSFHQSNIKLCTLNLANKKEKDDDWLEKSRVENKKNLQSLEGTEVVIPQLVSAKMLSALLSVRTVDILKMLIKMDMDPKDSNDYIDADVVEIIASEYKRIVVRNYEMEQLKPRTDVSKDENLPLRPPIVAIMGHVNHGKTTLLDTLRAVKNKIVNEEKGGITQKVSAFPVQYKDRAFTFVDTPGHAIFGNMRQRTAKLADIIVLVVAADKGVQYQTEEIIEFIKRSNTICIVALNKIDKKNLRINSVLNQLDKVGLDLEANGGEVPVVQISALQKKGVSELLEMIDALSSLHGIKGDKSGRPEVIIIDSKLDPNRGNLHYGIVKAGTLRKGQVLTSKKTFGKVKNIISDGKPLEIATPGTPVEIYGFDNFISPGEYAMGVPDLKEAKQIVEMAVRYEREEMRSRKEMETYKKKQFEEEQELIDRIEANQLGLDEEEYLKEKIEERKTGSSTSIPLIIKANNNASMEVLEDIIARFPKNELEIKIIKKGIGQVTLSDIDLCYYIEPKGMAVGFGVEMNRQVKMKAIKMGIKTNSFGVIYNFVDYLDRTLAERLPPEEKITVYGTGRIVKVFPITQKNKTFLNVAGCQVESGKFFRGSTVKLYRDGEQVWKGKIRQLRFFKDDVKEVTSGKECGIMFDDDYQEFKQGDTLECVNIELVNREHFVTEGIDVFKNIGKVEDT